MVRGRGVGIFLKMFFWLFYLITQSLRTNLIIMFLKLINNIANTCPKSPQFLLRAKICQHIVRRSERLLVYLLIMYVVYDGHTLSQSWCSQDRHVITSVEFFEGFCFVFLTPRCHPRCGVHENLNISVRKRKKSNLKIV